MSPKYLKLTCLKETHICSFMKTLCNMQSEHPITEEWVRKCAVGLQNEVVFIRKEGALLPSETIQV